MPTNDPPGSHHPNVYRQSYRSAYSDDQFDPEGKSTRVPRWGPNLVEHCTPTWQLEILHKHVELTRRTLGDHTAHMTDVGGATDIRAFAVGDKLALNQVTGRALFES